MERPHSHALPSSVSVPIPTMTGILELVKSTPTSARFGFLHASAGIHENAHNHLGAN